MGTPPNSQCPRLGSRLNPYEKFNVTPSTFAFQAYALFEFLLVLVAVLISAFVALPASWHGVHVAALNSAIFLAALLSLWCIACVESAQTQAAMCRALKVDACRHILFVAFASTAFAL